MGGGERQFQKFLTFQFDNKKIQFDDISYIHIRWCLSFKSSRLTTKTSTCKWTFRANATVAPGQAQDTEKTMWSTEKNVAQVF